MNIRAPIKRTCNSCKIDNSNYNMVWLKKEIILLNLKTCEIYIYYMAKSIYV